MDSVFEAYLGPDGVIAGAVGGVSCEPEDIPKINTNVWILGKCYNSIQQLDLIRRDVQSRLWCTYRRGFVPLGEPQLTTDKGWGCMLRCGQMVLAQALIDLHLGRDWFWTSESRDATYLKIVNRFEDSRKSFFSIHQIALMGDSEDKKVGQWFGPNTVAQVLKKLVRYDDWSSLQIHVAMDNTIVSDDIISLCLENPNNVETWKPLLLIAPLRLGLNEINPIYIPALKKCFELVGNCGMIGGRPNQALYFLGYVDDEALFLDPHTTQRSGSVGQKSSQDEEEFDETFHQKYAGRIQFTQMDPSLAVCFLCKSRMSFEVLLENFRTQVLPAASQPLFEIVKTRMPEWVSGMTGTTTSILPTTSSTTNMATPFATLTTTTSQFYQYPQNSSNNTDLFQTSFEYTSESLANFYDEIPTSLTQSSFCTTTSEEFKNSCSQRTLSSGGGDIEDFEKVDASSETKRSCCDGHEGSDDDFEFIS